MVGKVWARVMKLFGSDSTFDVMTDNAVAGVRGSALWVSTDGSVDEFVLDSGAMAVTVDGKEVMLKDSSAFLKVTGALLSCSLCFRVSSTGISYIHPSRRPGEYIRIDTRAPNMV